MPKAKTNRAARKRFRVSGGGKVMRRHANKNHNLAKKTRKRKRNLGKSTEISATNKKRAQRMLYI